MEEKNPVQLDSVSEERMRSLGIDVREATAEELLLFTAVAQTYYLAKIRFWISFLGITVLALLLLFLLAYLF